MSFFKNAAWMTGGTILVQVIAQITNIALARILSPEYFGVIGITSTIILFIYIVQEAGLNAVIIQKKEISNKLISTTFYLNITLSVILSIIILGLAPIIAQFYDMEGIRTILNFSVLGIFLGALGVTYKGLLMRERKFRQYTITELLSEAIAVTLTFILLYYNMIFYAISARLVIKPAVHSVILLKYFGINNFLSYPDYRLIKEIIPFGSKVLGIRVVEFTRNHIDYLIIGKLLGSYSLGLYTIAFQWGMLTKFYIGGSISKVVFPEVARNQDNLYKVSQFFLNILSKFLFLILPICFGFVFTSNEFILGVYGEKWIPTVHVLEVLVATGGVASFGHVISRIYQGLGSPEIDLSNKLYSTILLVPIIVFTSQWGIIAVSVGILINTILFETRLFVKIVKTLEIDFKQVIISFYKPLLATTITYIFYFTFKEYLLSVYWSFQSDLLYLCILLILQLFLYLIISYLINKDTVLWMFSKFKKIKQINNKARYS
ncbi:lipopolysaccharide biosynthesis protein [Halobacillus andaensis]|uniref:Lipopolysaccharide biosynthesis protein n=1 Tax=Halobacillus andaensis TaxID=1176239 RepID=A0A917B4B2_HALAA|nr:lipopolysaccharide biosynthesis protein [Halobacillus andaensis]MBP2004307.1 PST family polysaccharide transporter [Halobacillus andaensis]GGF22653.1 lipopolysaccharide biosynthesis protein [Halobacillus andaensis]